MANSIPGWKWVQVALPTEAVSSIECYGTVVSPSGTEAILFLLVTSGSDNARSFWAYTTSGDNGYYSELLGFPGASNTMPLGAVVANSKPTLVVKSGDSNVFACSLDNDTWSWNSLSTPAVGVSMAMGSVPANNVTNVLFLDTGKNDVKAGVGVDTQNLWAYNAVSDDWKLSELPPNTLGSNITTSMGTVIANSVPNILVLNEKNTVWACSLPTGSSNWKWSQLPKLPSTNRITTPMGTVLANGTASLLALDQNQSLWACSLPASGQWQWAQLPTIPYAQDAAIIPIQLGAAVVNSKANLFVLNKLKAGKTFLWSCQQDATGNWQWLQLPSLPDGSEFAPPVREASTPAQPAQSDATSGDAAAAPSSAPTSGPAATLPAQAPSGLAAIATNGTLNIIFLTSAEAAAAASSAAGIEYFWYCYNTPN